MSEKSTLKENQLLWQTHIVTITHPSTQTDDPVFYVDYGEPTGRIMCNAIQTLQPEQYKEIVSEIRKFEANIEQIRKEREELVEKEKMAKTLKDLEDFKTWFQQNAPKELLSREPHFKEVPHINCWDDVRVVWFYSRTPKQSRVELKPTSATTFDGWHSHPRQDSKNWNVEDNNYHKTSYKTLEKASAKIIELLDQYEKIENAATAKTDAYNTFAAECGLVIHKEWHHNEYDRQRRGYETYHMQPQTEKEHETPPYKFDLSIYADNKISVTNVTIHGPINLNLGEDAKDVNITFKNPMTTANQVKIFINSLQRAIKEAGAAIQ